MDTSCPKMLYDVTVQYDPLEYGVVENYTDVKQLYGGGMTLTPTIITLTTNKQGEVSYPRTIANQSDVFAEHH